MRQSSRSFRRALAHGFALMLVAAVAAVFPFSSLRAQTGTVTTLHSFAVTDGTDPVSGLVQGTDGNFYGTTDGGGGTGGGTIFQVTPAGALTTIYSFTNSTDGGLPVGQLIQGTDGNIYGTTEFFGASNGNGTIFRVTPAGALTTLYQFSGSTNGSEPTGRLVQGADGNFYGTTAEGGANGYGEVFQMTPSGTLTVLHSFNVSDGEYPYGGLVQGTDGYFYGTTGTGGSGSDGTIFKVAADGTFVDLHDFTGTDGANPYYASMIQAPDGALYGTTSEGGSEGGGTIFKIASDGTFTSLHSFVASEGFNPFGGLVLGQDGNFYGATTNGSSGGGILFQFTLAGALNVLYRFGGSDGANCQGALIQATDGAFYGTTSHGGSTYTSQNEGNGTVFRLDVTPSAGSLAFTAATYGVSENSGSVTLTVARTGGSAGAVSVSYSETDGTAYAGLDYQVMSGTLTWADGDSTGKTISIPINDRGITTGGTVSFSVGLTNPGGGATLGTIPTATVNILEEDAAPQPTIAIASPPPGFALISGMTTPVVLSIDDPGGITAQVQFLVNGSVAAEASAPPYSFSFGSSTLGSYTLAAAVTDTQGRVSTSSAVTVNVIAPNTNAAPPTSTLLTPVDGRSLAAGSTVTLNVAAAAASTTVLDHVSIYADGVLVATLNANGTSQASTGTGHPTRRDTAAAPGNVFQASYTLPDAGRIVNLVAAAFDILGQSNVTPVASVQSVVATQAPLVTLAGLTDGGQIEVGSTNAVNVSASEASIGAAVARSGRQSSSGSATLALLEYYINGSKLGQAAVPPYSFSFTPPAPGKYVLSAVATDTAGLATVSAPITVQAAAPPTVDLAVSGSGEAVEGGSNGVVIVSRTGDTSAPLVVAYKTKGSAQAGVDYKPLAGTVTIPAGSVKAKIKIKPLAGLSGAGNLKVKLLLLAPSDGSYTVGTSPVKVELLGN